MDLTKLYCIARFPQCWEEEYEERTGILASLESLERIAAKNPRKIYMTPKQMSQYRKMIGSGGVPGGAMTKKMTVNGNFNQIYYYNDIPLEIRK